MNLLTNVRDTLNDKHNGYHENKVMKIGCREEEYDGKKVVAIRIRDNGNGIDKEITDRIFDPLFTTKERNIGTGMRIAISYGIIKEHDSETGFTTK